MGKAPSFCHREVVEIPMVEQKAGSLICAYTYPCDAYSIMNYVPILLQPYQVKFHLINPM